MPTVLSIESSPRGSKSASLAVAHAFLDAYRAKHPEMTLDTLNVWEENLPEFDQEAIGAKYKGAASEEMHGSEAAIWKTIQSLAERFQRANRIVVGVPMWNFAYPYKLKQLIDLACQRKMLFTFDGKQFGPGLSTPRALVIYTRGQAYAEGTAISASAFDHQTPYIDFWLRFIGVQEVQKLVVENTWSDEAEARIAKGCEQARALANKF